MFQTKEFAEMGTVTVRTLHHYDRLGLLKPSHRSGAGYRLYTHADLGRLERILVLRYLGLSLREIRGLLAAGRSEHDSLPVTLQRQARVLRERRAGLDRVLRAIDHALAKAGGADAGDDTPEWLLYQTILKEINMTEQLQWTEKYYSPEAQESVEARRATWDPSKQAEVIARWQQVYADVQSAMDRGVEPRSDEGRVLAKRWMDLVGEFTGGNPQVLAGMNKLYGDRANWPADGFSEEARANLPKPEHMAFVHAAQEK